MSFARSTTSVASIVAVTLALCGGFAGPARGQAVREPAPAPSDSGAFIASDSTLVVLVPAGASTASVLGAIRAVRGRSVAAVYTTDDPVARQLASALANTVGASLIPYDRAGATTTAYAARLLRNAVSANPRGAVILVGEPGLTDPLYRQAAAASNVATPPDAHVGGRADGVVVLAVAPNTRALVRARF